VVGRHGAGAPTLVNYDVMRASELRSGYSEEDAWDIAYSGCQWYCSVGKEYNDQDLNSLVLVQPMQRAMQIAAAEDITEWEDFWEVYDREVNRTADVLVAFKNNTYKWQAKVWPEIVTSLCMHGPIENGRDVTDVRAVNNNYTSVNVLGVPNVVDSMYALKELVFTRKKYSMKRLLEALERNWEGDEVMRHEFLKQPKFGNDIDSVDEMALQITSHVRELLENKHNIKGFHFRPSLFQFMGHTYAGPMVGATPDGRLAQEPLAHGMNPMHGRNTQGILPTIRSFTRIDYAGFQGGSFQIELHPSFFPDDQDRGSLVELFATGFFGMGGVQINLNVLDINTLKQAMKDPDNPEYRNIVVKVTGYSAHFVVMDRKFQEEFVQRVNYQSL
jgi:formate C-acetyltransferase